MEVIKVKKAVKLPKTMKATKKLKTKSKDVYRVVNWLHLGLGLRKGDCYKGSHLRQLCKGSPSKLKRLENFMKDPTMLRPEGHASGVAISPREKVIVSNN